MSEPHIEQPKEATPVTQDRNRAVLTSLPFGDTQDFDDASRGFIASLPDVEIQNTQDRVIWSLREYAFLAHEAAPATVNPSLWRQARLNMNNGLYQVADRIYQVRGFDISNMTLIEGDRGLIIIDPLVSVETARAALDLYRAHRGERPITAVIYSHSHVDHYGGVKGVIDEADVQAGHVAVIAPDRFLEEVTQEQVLVGGPMVRRAQFQFGATLFKGPRGQVDAGLGKVVSRGTVTLIAPTQIIREPVEVHVIDGVEIVFQLTPDTEAKAEMHMYYPGLKALNLAENVTHNLHNIYPIRGAQVRDANAWAKYIDEARDRYASEADVVFAQHHWPVWGNARIMDYLAKQRDAYKYLHDQTLRLINHGLKATEIAEQLTMPQSLENTWSVRGYYGTLSHNAKSIYQRYIGWYDANPAHLNPLPPSERGAKLVDYVGGEAAAMAKAREDFDRGEYRWVAEIMNEVIFANPANQEARHLAADALEQLGYQAESATWRNAYLQGAHELRNGVPQNLMRAPISADVVQALTVPLFFDYLAVRLNGPKAEGQHLVINWVFPDLAERYTLTLENCALTYMAGKTADHAHVTVTLARPVLSQLVLQQITLTDAIHEGAIALEGDGSKLSDLFELIDEFRFMFHILEPRQEP
ncbi:alkyl/aryl-sulfatase [Candidatus Entotheonella palauensis]|uniref:alkyl/aryl-sulfatase n=1 Tax=Candidatus Entotheonella palauensis TaxID=93172 RepID=UPI000B7D8909|nr:alkyl sulfatase dimerization domain-containing protein [Candidatus Entotheonella palauensis]